MSEFKFGHGFTLIRSCPVAELDAVMYHLRHERTALELVWLSRAEENKTFGIAFQTMPEDDTGVFHILEHSVLCGSENYPVKDPFVELMKNSMNTFLNALTFSDRTFYPISSRNGKDFMNLTRVYLDAVFRPLIYSRPEIFRQEGWHYEFDENGAASVKGVVYNEMRGVFADVDELESLAVQRSLFPDTPYRFESGGDPESIPSLTYEAFLESHRRCYSPSNAYVFLDGDVDIDAVLALLDGEYLAGHERTERLGVPALQRPVRPEPRRVEFELPAEEDAASRWRYVWSGVIGEIGEREKLTAMQLLAGVLCGDNQSLLSRTVLESGLVESLNMEVFDSVAQPYVRLEAQNLREEDIPRVKELIRAELERIAREGVDRPRLEAAMANLEFQLRERDYGTWPQGLIFGFSVLDSWMRGGAPEARLEVGSLFDTLREWAREGRFEELIRSVLLESGHCCEVVMAPSHTAGEERRAAEAARVEREAAGWSDECRGRLEAEQRELLSWQQSDDTSEQLASLPRLELADIDPEPPAYPTVAGEAGGVRLLRHELPSNGISYVNLYFDVTGLGSEELSALGLLTALLGRVDTAGHDASELSRLTQLEFGSLSFLPQTFERSRSDCTTVLAVQASFLNEKADAALALLGEVLRSSRLDNPRQVLELLRQTRTQTFQRLISNGHTTALGRAAAQLSSGGAAAEHASGCAYYRWLKDAEQLPFGELAAALERVRAMAVGRGGLTVSVTGESCAAVDAALEGFLAYLPEGETRPNAAPAAWGRRREGIEIPSDVGYAALGVELDNYSGAWQLASRVVSLAWLWNAVRVQGGAYGTGMVAREQGFAGFYSYRDPSAAATLESCAASADFLERFAVSGESLDGFIIGAVSANDPLQTVRAKGLTADSLWFRGITDEMRRNRRRELLGATPERLAEIANALREAIRNPAVSVLAPKSALDTCGLDEKTSL